MEQLSGIETWYCRTGNFSDNKFYGNFRPQAICVHEIFIVSSNVESKLKQNLPFSSVVVLCWHDFWHVFSVSWGRCIACYIQVPGRRTASTMEKQIHVSSGGEAGPVMLDSKPGITINSTLVYFFQNSNFVQSILYPFEGQAVCWGPFIYNINIDSESK